MEDDFTGISNIWPKLKITALITLSKISIHVYTIYLYVILYHVSLSSRNTMWITFKYIYSLFSFLLIHFCISIIFFIFPDSSNSLWVFTIIIPMKDAEGRALDASSRATTQCGGAGFCWLAATLNHFEYWLRSKWYINW